MLAVSWDVMDIYRAVAVLLVLGIVAIVPWKAGIEAAIEASSLVLVLARPSIVPRKMGAPTTIKALTLVQVLARYLGAPTTIRPSSLVLALAKTICTTPLVRRTTAKIDAGSVAVSVKTHYMIFPLMTITPTMILWLLVLVVVLVAFLKIALLESMGPITLSHRASSRLSIRTTDVDDEFEDYPHGTRHEVIRPTTRRGPISRPQRRVQFPSPNRSVQCPPPPRPDYFIPRGARIPPSPFGLWSLAQSLPWTRSSQAHGRSGAGYDAPPLLRGTQCGPLIATGIHFRETYYNPQGGPPPGHSRGGCLRDY